MLRNLLLTIVAATFLGMYGCDSDGSAEQAGESLDNTVDGVKDTADDVGDSLSEAAEDACDEVGDAANSDVDC